MWRSYFKLLPYGTKQKLLLCDDIMQQQIRVRFHTICKNIKVTYHKYFCRQPSF